ncbi:MAG: hypothetical protein NWQ11_00280 [Pseudomonadales bacterium]|nr:hypothetical protein [Pseudomonadales bacterium]
MNAVEQLSEDYQQLCLLAAWVQQPRQAAPAHEPDQLARLEALADADLAIALAHLSIAVTALQITHARALNSAELRLLVTIQVQRLSQDIYRLAHQTLGYLALVDEVPGTNEPLLVPAEFRRLSRNYLNSPEAATAAAKQQLALLLQT